jgi:flagellin-like protein
LNKRGISPLIATVLIIGFTIVLAVLVIAWLSGVFQGQLSEQDCQVENLNYCSSIQNLLESRANYDSSTDATTGGTISTEIVFYGTEKPDKINIEFIDENGAVKEIKTLDNPAFTNGKETISSDQAEYTDEVKNIQIIPRKIIEINGQQCPIYTCPSSTATFNGAKCTGKPDATACSGIGDSTVCDEMIGCSWTLGSCQPSGSAFIDCGLLSDTDKVTCEALLGCQWTA